jgi:hypothetical protein
MSLRLRVNDTRQRQAVRRPGQVNDAEGDEMQTQLSQEPTIPTKETISSCISDLASHGKIGARRRLWSLRALGFFIRGERAPNPL